MGTKKVLTDVEIVQELCTALHLSANSLSENVGYSNSSSIYHILNAKQSISRGFIERVLSKYPNVSELFLRTGEEPIILENSQMVGQRNLKFENKISFDDIPGLLFEIKNLLSSIDSKMDEK